MRKKQTSFKTAVNGLKVALTAPNFEIRKAKAAEAKESHQALSHDKQAQNARVCEMNEQWNKLKGGKV